MKCYEDIKIEFLEKYEDGEDYCKSLEYYMDNFETIINNKRGRKSRKKNNNNNNENININICISDWYNFNIWNISIIYHFKLLNDTTNKLFNKTIFIRIHINIFLNN